MKVVLIMLALMGTVAVSTAYLKTSKPESEIKESVVNVNPFFQVDNAAESGAGPVAIPSKPVHILPVLPGDVRNSKANNKRISRINVPAEQVIFLLGPIGANAADIVDQINDKSRLHKTLYLLIDSPGGSVIDGATIISAIEGSSAKINTVCLSLCASMAQIILSYGSERMALDRALIMAHPASGQLQGTLDQMGSRLDMITSFVNKMDAYIATRAHTTLESYKALIANEFWLDAEDALARGYLDRLVYINTDAKPPKQVSLFSDQQGHRDLKKDFKLVR